MRRPALALVAPALLAVLALPACSSDKGAPHLARGNVLVNTGHREEAVAEYREAVRLSPKSEVARERLADTLYDLDRKEEALRWYHQAMQVDPDQVTPRIGAARVLADLGDLASARAELTAALEKAPTNLYARLSRGNLAARAGDRKAALADFEQAVHLKSDNVPALSAYALALLDDGQQLEAAATVERLIGLAPGSPAGWYAKARLLARKGDAAGAGAAVRQAHDRALPDARAALAEQGVAPEQLELRAEDQAGRAAVALRDDPAFAWIAPDPAFRAAAGLQPVGDKRSAVETVNQQLAAYNARDLDRFARTYAEGITITSGGKPMLQGLQALRERYGGIFAKYPKLHVEILERKLEGDAVVIDRELIFGRGPEKPDPWDAGWVRYRVEAGLIQVVELP